MFIEKRTITLIALCMSLLYPVSNSKAQTAADTGKPSAGEVDPMFFQETETPATVPPAAAPVSQPPEAATPLPAPAEHKGAEKTLTPAPVQIVPEPNMPVVPETSPAVPVIELPKVPGVTPKIDLPVSVPPKVDSPAPIIPFPAISAPSQSVPVPNMTPLLPSGEEIDDEDEPVEWKGSLMFDEKSIKLLNDAMESFLTGKPLELPAVVTPEASAAAAAAALAAKEQAAQPTVLPVFYLNSIVYFSPSNWSIWLNNTKISPVKKPQIPELKIVNITDRQVFFTWSVKNLDRISPNWMDKLKEDSDGDFSNSDNTIKVSAEKDSVGFALGPNQSFSVQAMEIMEGKTQAAPLPPTIGDAATEVPAQP
jgi:hypothetical protein